jgi:hypothetical protein
MRIGSGRGVWPKSIHNYYKKGQERGALLSIGVAERVGCKPGEIGSHPATMRREKPKYSSPHRVKRNIATIFLDPLKS